MRTEKIKNILDGSSCACYIMTVALKREGALSEHCFCLDRRGMYPENYTMQNMLDNESNKPDATSLMSVNEKQFFYKNEGMSRQALG